MNPDENPVDYRDRHEVEACLIFSVVCVCFFGIAFNLFVILSHSH